MTNEEIRQRVDEYAALMAEAERIKSRLEELKGYFETQAAGDLMDTKRKTVEYWGSQNSRVVVSSSATVKAVSPSTIHNLLGEIADDYLRQETVWKLTEPCKRLLSNAVQGEYLEGSLEETIRQISADPKIQSALWKRLKGSYTRDKRTLMKIAGLSEEEAGETAYLTAEIINWERLAQVLRAAKWTGSPQEAIRIIRASAVVEESVKVSLEMEKAK